MSPSQTERRRAFQKSFREPRILPGEHPDEIRVVFRAFGPFDPSLFERTRAALIVSMQEGYDRRIPGTLFEVKSDQPRGTNYPFSFWPDRPEELKEVVFRGRNHDSNISKIEFSFSDCVRWARNPFFKPLSS
jgi:hypothetical protein